MKFETAKLSNRFLISVVALGFISAAYSYYSVRVYRSQYFASLRSAESLAHEMIETRREILNQKFATRVRSLKRMADFGFSENVTTGEGLATSDWLWIKAGKFQWSQVESQNDLLVSVYGNPKLKRGEFNTILDSERKRMVFQWVHEDLADPKAEPKKVALENIEAVLDLSSSLTPATSQAFPVAVFFVGPDGSIYSIGGDQDLLDFRPGKKSKTKLADLKDSASGFWRDSLRTSNLPLKAESAILAEVEVPGLRGKLLVGSRSSINAGWRFPLLMSGLLLSVWAFFFRRRIWTKLPESLETWGRAEFNQYALSLQPPSSLKFVDPTNSTGDDQLRDRFLDGSLKESTLPQSKGTIVIDSQAIQFMPQTVLNAGPPSALPKLYLKKKAEERKNKTFEIELNVDERQSFLRRMSLEVAELNDLASLGNFFSNTFTRLLDGTPAAFFAVDPKDGRVQLLSRSPEDLFSRVIPAAFLPVDSEDSFERAASLYMRDVSLLSSDLIAGGSEWSIFGLGSGNRKAGFWAFPLRLGPESKFFVRMLCEIFLGHYLFLKSEELERRKTFFQSDLLRDRLVEETLQNTRLRHPFSLALLETKLVEGEKAALDSLVYGLKADETLKVGAFLREKVRRSDRIFTLKENQIAIFFPHTAVLDLLGKIEKMLSEWNSVASGGHSLRAIMVEFPTHGDSADALDRVMRQSFEQLKGAIAGQVLLASAPVGYLPPFKSRFIRSAIIPGSPS